MSASRLQRRAFSLIELVIVVVIIGIIAAIAIPRMSRGAAGAGDSSLIGDLAVLRKAIDIYAAEHGGAFPSVANVTNALAQYSDEFGALSATKDATHTFGPYLRSIPPLSVNCPRKGCTGIAAADAAGVGWIYDATLGTIHANTTIETDAAGVLYSAY
jgi:general secretion pathway protein G